jgi:pimeloyl-ACP methyl ester carboxylesterase
MRNDEDWRQNRSQNTGSEYYTPWPNTYGAPQQPTASPGTPYYPYITPPPVNAPPNVPPPVNVPPPQQPRKNNKLLYSMVAVLAVVVLILAGSYIFFIKPSPVSTPKTTITPQATKTSPQISSDFQFSTDCPFDPGRGITIGKDVRCGNLTVPEDRNNPGGQTIQLAVAIFKGTGSQDAAGPMLYLSGGPGGGALGDLGGLISASNLPAISLGHDLILLDQRGTGYSQPALDCHEITDLQDSTTDENMSREQAINEYVQAAQQCHDRLVQSGINLNAYTTIDNATDVHALIHALGYKQINLYGVSYGTRLALTVMRLFPDDLRSVILDSTVPTQSNLFKTLPGVIQHAFNVLFQGCANSPTCNRKYPNLDSVFYKLVTDLNDKPVTIHDINYGPISLNGDGLANWLFSTMYATELIPVLPEAISQISKGDYAIISQYYGLIELQGGVSDGMYYSVECGEDAAFTNEQELEQSTNEVHSEIKPDVLSGLQSDMRVCQIWGEKPVPNEQKQPVVSSLPTLILSGEYDPITPLSNAQQAMQTLSKSFLFTFPGTGHGVFLTNACPNNIMTAFLQNPAQKPSGGCITAMREPNFE